MCQYRLNVSVRRTSCILVCLLNDLLIQRYESGDFAEPLRPSKAKFLKELKASVEEVVLAKQGKIKLKTAEELLNEL